MNWRKVEQRLRDASVEALRAFVRDHPGEAFYGFCFDVNADYREVCLSLNTEEDLWAHAARIYPSYSPREIEGEDGSLEPIARAEGFKTLVRDHDETDEDSWARLLRVRNRRR